MNVQTDYSLRDLNTFRVPAIARRYARFETTAELVDFLRGHLLGENPHLVLGGGSNLLFVGDFNGIVLHPRFRGVEEIAGTGSHIRVRAMAGETWDDLVALAVAQGWGGIENLSLIPGTVGASAVQNIGAYGVEVERRIERVEAIGVDDGRAVRFAAADCGFGYRHSHFKERWKGRYIITAVVVRLDRRPRLVLDYPGVRDAVDALGNADLNTVRQAIITIRQRKLPDPAVLGNAGSFFKNPVVDRPVLENLLSDYPGLPHYPQADGRYKLAAGWLIERCGLKGRRVGRAAVHDQQALVLVNLGGATGGEILALSEKVRAAVLDRFGILLEREVQVVLPVEY